MRRAALNHLILLAGVGFLVTPLVLIVLLSTQSSAMISSEGLQFAIGDATRSNYARVFNIEAGFTRTVTTMQMLQNSLVVAMGVATLTTLLSLMSAYALVFFRWRLASLLFWVILATLLLPIEARFIPTFGVIAELGLVNTQLGIILPTLALALGTFFLRQFMLTLPPELMEAARLDAATPFRYFTDIVVPLSKGRAGAVFVIAFMIGWNQYLWPIMVATDDSLYTLVRGLQLIGGAGSGPGMAFVVITIGPPLILVWMFQRWFFRSLVDVEK